MNQLLVPDAQDMNSKSGFALSICHLDLLSRIHLLQNHITKHACKETALNWVWKLLRVLPLKRISLYSTVTKPHTFKCKSLV
jgi:hypothetical protein